MTLRIWRWIRRLRILLLASSILNGLIRGRLQLISFVLFWYTIVLIIITFFVIILVILVFTFIYLFCLITAYIQIALWFSSYVFLGSYVWLTCILCFLIVQRHSWGLFKWRLVALTTSRFIHLVPHIVLSSLKFFLRFFLLLLSLLSF